MVADFVVEAFVGVAENQKCRVVDFVTVFFVVVGTNFGIDSRQHFDDTGLARTLLPDENRFDCNVGGFERFRQRLKLQAEVCAVGKNLSRRRQKFSAACREVFELKVRHVKASSVAVQSSTMSPFASSSTNLVNEKP